MSTLTTLKELANETDGELLARYRQHSDGDAFAILHDRHYERLFAYAKRELRGRADAEDIVQETFAEFHEHHKQYPLQTCVRALLFKILIDRCGMYLRRVEAAKRDHRLTRPLLASDPDPKADASKQTCRIEANELLSTLTHKQEEAIRLTKLDGHTAEEAAELLDVPPTTVRKRVKDGMNTLKVRSADDND